jgi:hypothetical protein
VAPGWPQYCQPITEELGVICFGLIGPLDDWRRKWTGDGKLPSVDHGRRTDRGRDKKSRIFPWMPDKIVCYNGMTFLNQNNQNQKGTYRSVFRPS